MKRIDISDGITSWAQVIKRLSTSALAILVLSAVAMAALSLPAEPPMADNGGFSSWWAHVVQTSESAAAWSVSVIPWLGPAFPALIVAILVWLAIPSATPTPRWVDDSDEAHFDDPGELLQLAEIRIVVSGTAVGTAAIFVCWSVWGIVWMATGQATTELWALIVLLPVVLATGCAAGRFSAGPLAVRLQWSREHLERVTRRKQALERRVAWRSPDGGRQSLKRAPWITALAGWLLSSVVLCLANWGAEPRPPFSWGGLLLCVFVAFSFAVFAAFAALGTYVRLAASDWTDNLFAALLLLVWAALAVAMIVTSVMSWSTSSFLFLIAGLLPGVLWLLPWWAGSRFVLAGPAMRTIEREEQHVIEERKTLEAALRARYRPGGSRWRRALTGLISR